MYTPILLRSLRNDLPMDYTIACMGTKGPDAKEADGRYRFLCPHCSEMIAVVNKQNNLAHCFACRRNINNIDLLIAHGHSFKEAVALLRIWLDQYNKQANVRPHQMQLFEQQRNTGPRTIARILADMEL